MIAWMNSWIQGVVIAVIIAVIIEMIIPEREQQKIYQNSNRYICNIQYNVSFNNKNSRRNIRFKFISK